MRAVVQLIDSRRWDRLESLAPATGGGDCDISGIAFSDRGTRLWIGMEEGCASYHVDALSRRTFDVPSVMV